MRLRLFTDGASRGNPGEAAAGMVLRGDGDGGPVAREEGHYLGRMTNNQAEYRALIAGLEMAARESPEELEVCLDSELVVQQVNGRWRVKSDELRPLWMTARRLLAGFPKVRVRYIPREQNKRADWLANVALDARLPASAQMPGASYR